LALELDAHGHGRTAVAARRHPEAHAQIDRGDDAAAQIEHARDFRRRERHPRQPIRHENVLHPADRQPEELTVEHHGHVFDDRVVEFAVRFRHDVAHAAASHSTVDSLSAAIRPGRSNLATKSWKPAWRPRSIDAGEVTVESAMIGIAAVRGSRRTASASSKPLMPGISMSDTITSKRSPALSRVSASSAPAAVVTS